MKKQRKYWYFIYIQSCPICCSEKKYRERKYTKKPKKYWLRHEEKEVYDYCDAL